MSNFPSLWTTEQRIKSVSVEVKFTSQVSQLIIIFQITIK